MRPEAKSTGNSGQRARIIAIRLPQLKHLNNIEVLYVTGSSEIEGARYLRVDVDYAAFFPYRAVSGAGSAENSYRVDTAAVRE